jgi:hypothetical protein
MIQARPKRADSIGQYLAIIGGCSAPLGGGVASAGAYAGLHVWLTVGLGMLIAGGAFLVVGLVAIKISREPPAR